MSVSRRIRRIQNTFIWANGALGEEYAEKAAGELALANIPLVTWFVRTHDLVMTSAEATSLGYEALYNAALKWNPTRGSFARLAAYYFHNTFFKRVRKRDAAVTVISMEDLDHEPPAAERDCTVVDPRARLKDIEDVLKANGMTHKEWVILRGMYHDGYTTKDLMQRAKVKGGPPLRYDHIYDIKRKARRILREEGYRNGVR